MTRRVIQHQSKSVDNEYLTVVHVFEEGINKEEAKRVLPFSRKHELLIKRNNRFEYTK